MLKKHVMDVGLKVLRSKYAKWAICGTIGFIAEHASGKMYDSYILKEVDATDI